MSAALGMPDSEAVAAGILQADPAILHLFEETGMQDSQGMMQKENRSRHHVYHVFQSVDPAATPAAVAWGGLLIALRADTLAAEEVLDVVDIVPSKAMALDVVTCAGALSVVNVHGPRSDGDSWAINLPTGPMWSCSQRPIVHRVYRDPTLKAWLLLNRRARNTCQNNITHVKIK